MGDKLVWGVQDVGVRAQPMSGMWDKLVSVVRDAGVKAQKDVG